MQKLLIVSARQFADKQEEMRTPAWLEWNSGEKFCNTFSCATPLESHVCVGTLQIIPTRDLHFRHFYQQPSSQSKGCCLSACHHAWRLKMLQSTSSKCVTCAVPSVIRQCGGRWLHLPHIFSLIIIELSTNTPIGNVRPCDLLCKWLPT